MGTLKLESNLFLSPLAGYTNLPFRLVIREVGGVDLCTTDLVNARSLLERNPKALKLIETNDIDRPLAVQLFGGVAEEMRDAALYLESIGISAIDINMGCPVRKVVKTGGGSAMMTELDKTQKLVRGMVDALKIPVTAKMRLGWDDDNITAPDLARALEGSHFDVVLMEIDGEKSERLANELPHVTVICGDATRRVTLEEERAGNADVFVACIGDDDSNMLAGAEARDIGAKKILCVVSRPDYVNLMEKLGIDVAISPRQAMARQIRTFLNTGPVISRTMLHNKNIGVFEIEVQPGSPATEHVLANLDLPAGKCLIAARGHDGQVILPRADEKFEAGDLVVALIDNSSVETTLEKFSVGGV